MFHIMSSKGTFKNYVTPFWAISLYPPSPVTPLSHLPFDTFPPLSRVTIYVIFPEMKKGKK